MGDIGNTSAGWALAAAVQQVQNGDPHSEQTSAAWDYIDGWAGASLPGSAPPGDYVEGRDPVPCVNNLTGYVNLRFSSPEQVTQAMGARQAKTLALTPEEQAAAIIDVIDQPLFLSEDDLPQYGKPGPYSCSRCLGPRGTRRGTLCVYCALEQEQKQEQKQELAPAGNRVSLVQQVRQLPVPILVALLIVFACMLLVGLMTAGIVSLPVQ